MPHLTDLAQGEVSASMHPPRGHQIGINVRSEKEICLFVYVNGRLLPSYTRAEFTIETHRLKCNSFSEDTKPSEK